MKKFSLFNQVQSSKGFTLVELLVVLGIFVVVGGVIVSVLYISLQGSSKSETLTVVKQNGSFALSQIVKQIRFARSIDTPASCVPSTNTPSITVTSLSDGAQTTFDCSAGSNTILSSNSAALIDRNAVAATYCSFTCTQENESQPPRVSIQFKLAPVANGTIQTQSEVPFQASVVLRNAVK